MHRIFLIALLCVAGCQNIRGPFAPRDPRPVDDPLLTIGEQQRRGRDRYAIPEPSPKLAPPTYIDQPGPTGR